MLSPHCFCDKFVRFAGIFWGGEMMNFGRTPSAFTGAFGCRDKANLGSSDSSAESQDTRVGCNSTSQLRRNLAVKGPLDYQGLHAALWTFVLAYRTQSGDLFLIFVMHGRRSLSMGTMASLLHSASRWCRTVLAAACLRFRRHWAVCRLHH